MSKAVVLLSGGMDSATSAAVARDDGFELFCLSFDYGQRNRFELRAAKKLAKIFGAQEHKIIALDLRKIGGSALTAEIPVPKDRLANADKSPKSTEIPITYVPARNIIFLSIAVAWAETLGARDIFIGVNAIDYSGYPDCRFEFIRAFEQAVNLGTKAGAEGSKFNIRTPLINLSKKEIVLLGNKLGVDYSLTVSCYDPDAEGRACGRCDACTLRKRAFEQANLPDPTRYV